jgi:hypothetical protein
MTDRQVKELQFKGLWAQTLEVQYASFKVIDNNGGYSNYVILSIGDAYKEFSAKFLLDWDSVLQTLNKEQEIVGSDTMAFLLKTYSQLMQETDKKIAQYKGWKLYLIPYSSLGHVASAILDLPNKTTTSPIQAKVKAKKEPKPKAAVVTSKPKIISDLDKLIDLDFDDI